MFNLDTDVPRFKEVASTEWVTYLGVFFISIWGGAVDYMDKKGSESFSWKSITAHVMSSSFAGMMVALGCQYAGISGPLMGVLAGVAAHMGTPALIQMAKKIKFVKNFIGDDAAAELK